MNGRAVYHEFIMFALWKGFTKFVISASVYLSDTVNRWKRCRERSIRPSSNYRTPPASLRSRLVYKKATRARKAFTVVFVCLIINYRHWLTN